MMALPKLKVMSLAAARKIRQLVEAGVVVSGPKPQRTATLQDYPGCDVELKRIADDLWDKGRHCFGEDNQGGIGRFGRGAGL